MRKMQYLLSENLFFEGALLRRRRGEGEANGRNTHAKSASKIMRKSCFCRTGRPCSNNSPKMTSRSPSGTLPGSPREAEIDQLFAPRGPKEASIEFFGAPGRPRAAAKSDLGRSRRPPWAHMAPRSAQEPSGPSFWTLRPPPGSIFRSFFEMSCLLFSRVHVAVC